MALSIDNIIQTVSGTVNGTGTTVTFPSATTAGSLILVYTHTGATGINGFEPPAGGAGTFDLCSSGPSLNANGCMKNFYQRRVAGGENNYTLNLNGGGASELGAWVALEVIGVGVDVMSPISGGGAEIDPWFLKTANGTINVSASPVASDSTGFIPDDVDLITECFTAMSIAAFGANNLATTIPTLSGYPDGWTELAQVGIANATHALALSVAVMSLTDLGRMAASVAVSPNSYLSSDHNVFYADGGKYSPRLDLICGWEFGTATGLTSTDSISSNAPVDAITGSPEVGTAHARSGAYCLKLSSVAAVENVTWNNSLGTLAEFWPVVDPYSQIERFCFFFETLLPVVDVQLASIEAGSLANGMTVTFRAASGKIGVQIGSGTEVLSDSAVTVNTWIAVDLRYDPTRTTHLCDWAVDYDASTSDTVAAVAQTRATQTGMTSAAPTTTRLGWTAATTATVFYDDIAVSKQWGSYPLGDIRIIALKADQAGTPTITGTTANFKTFTSNGGTITAWTAANTRANLADVPPVIGASADGVVQASAASGDWCNIPMETFTAAPDYCLRAVRWYVAGWAASTSVATLGVRSNDGANNIFNVFVGDHGFDNATMVWLCGMQRRFANESPRTGSYPLTQARLDGLTLSIGGSTDATPDVGIVGAVAEVAYVPAVAQQLASGEDGTFTVYVKQDPTTGAYASLTVTTPPGTRGATLSWTKNGVDGTQYVAANDLQVRSLGADTVADVTSVGLALDTSI